MVQLLWKTFGQFLTRWNMQQYDPAVMFLGIYRTEMKTHVHTKTCIWMFIVILFIIAKHWKQLRCPSVGEWMNKLWYIHTVEYYSVLKRETVKPWKIAKWKKPIQKAIYCMIPTICHCGIGKTIETVKRKNQWLPGREREEKMNRNR